MLIYQYTPDDLPVAVTPLNVDDDSSDWWAGAQKCFASIAIIATLSFTAQAQVAQTLQWQDEIPAGSLIGQPEELYWQQGPPSPVPATIYQQLPYLPDPEEIPANTLKAQPEELYWQQGPAPIPASLLWPQQWSFEQDEHIWLYVDELYWQNSAAPISASLYQNFPYWYDTDDVVPQTTPFQPDEDYELRLLTNYSPSGFLFTVFIDSDQFTRTPPPPGVQNYINTGTNNYVSQRIGEGVEY